ncbi:MAG: hypothetical protein GY820_25630 [Gammaproteobacteria bacterium]|nr:hypothetical protein [Gammaproteobacteria bacterium]
MSYSPEFANCKLQFAVNKPTFANCELQFAVGEPKFANCKFQFAVGELKFAANCGGLKFAANSSLLFVKLRSPLANQSSPTANFSSRTVVN